MTQSTISLVVAVVVLPCVTIFSGTRYRRENRDEPVTPLARHASSSRLAAPQALTWLLEALGRASAISLSRSLSPDVKGERIEKADLTYAMWGILMGVTLMFSAALQRYRHSLQRKREIHWLDEHPVLDRLRKQL